MSTLLLAEHDAHGLHDVTARALSAVAELGAPVDILVAGENCAAAAEAARRYCGVARVLLAEAPALGSSLAEPLAALILHLAPNYSVIAAPATSTGRNVLPRVAALLDVMQVSEVTRVVSPDTFERSIYAGNAVQTVRATDAVKVLTIRSSAFSVAASGDAVAPLDRVEAAADPQLSSFVSEEQGQSERPELDAARIIVSGGRALGSAEKFREVIEPLADRLGAAIGASRAAVDAGFAPNSCQVGQTGKVVAPELYLAIGISGAIQHLAGMKGSKVIVAINKDAQAPIFRIADYGLVADLFQAVPELMAELDKAGIGAPAEDVRKAG
jgi:electron transfer flavoprotein alpha subunit